MEPQGETSTIYNFLFAIFGVLIIGLVGFNVYLLIDSQGSSPTDASVADSTITAEEQSKAPPLLDLLANFDTLSFASQSIQASEALSAELVTGEYTIFAPADSAFSLLIDKPNQDDFDTLFSYHIIEGTVSTETLDANMDSTITMYDGNTLTVGKDGESYTLTDQSGTTSYLTDINFAARNGAIHVINQVLFPPEIETTE